MFSISGILSIDRMSQWSWIISLRINPRLFPANFTWFSRSNCHCSLKRQLPHMALVASRVFFRMLGISFIPSASSQIQNSRFVVFEFGLKEGWVTGRWRPSCLKAVWQPRRGIEPWRAEWSSWRKSPDQLTREPRSALHWVAHTPLPQVWTHQPSRWPWKFHSLRLFCPSLAISWF